MELFANSSSSTLNGAITNSQTTVTVTAAASFPTSGNFRILIDSEILLVTAVGGNVFTVTRGIENTVAASHLTAAPVTGILTAGALSQYRIDGCGGGIIANLPTPGSVGRLYVPTDVPIILRDNGSDWLKYGPLQPYAPPLISSFPIQVNLPTTHTLVDSPLGIFYSAPTPSSSDYATLLVKPAPATPFTVTAGFLNPPCPAQYSFASVVNYNSTSTSLMIPMQLWQGLVTLRKLATPTSYSGQVTSAYGSLPNSAPYYTRYTNDGVNRYYSISFDGYNFTSILTDTNTDLFVDSHVGICFWTINQDIINTCHYWTGA
jgi:hypothetical protein